MRASLVFVAGLLLAGCSSSSLPSSNPQLANASKQKSLASPSGDRLRLRFENGNKGFTNLYMYAFNSSFKCIASVTPEDIFLEGGQTSNFDIQAKTDGACKDADRAVDFAMTDVTYTKDFAGDLEVRYSPQSGWRAKIKREFGSEPCTQPSGFREGVALKDNELIKIYFCP